MTITEFLLTRIADDEAVAEECLKPKNLHPYGDERIPAIKPEEWGSLAKNYLGGDMGTHCARHDPARVLAECAAKRTIIERHAIHVYQGIHGQDVPECAVGDGFPCDTLQALASVHKGHEDYQPEWAL